MTADWLTRVLDASARLKAANGQPPTLSELAAEAGLPAWMVEQLLTAEVPR